jgi:predicted TIM-barrel fold metal-dependent hydrolase
LRIDVHAHYYPKEYADLLVSLGKPEAAHAAQSSDLSPRLADMDEVGVDCQILSSVALDVVLEKPADAALGARFINDAYKELVDTHGGRFQAFGQVPLPHLDEAIAETGRCLDELRFVGVNLPCWVQNRPIDDPEFDPFWAELDRRGAVVYIHPVGTHSRDICGMREYGLNIAYGSPLQLGVCATRLLYTGLTKRYPRIRFAFAFLGGMLPYLWPRLERNLRRAFDGSVVPAVGQRMFGWVQEAAIEPDDPLGGLREFYYDTSAQDMPWGLLCAKQSYGADRLLLGSDAIFASLIEAVAYIEESEFLTADEKAAVLDVNAQSLLNLAAPASRTA